jgi:hypothetical protein
VEEDVAEDLTFVAVEATTTLWASIILPIEDLPPYCRRLSKPVIHNESGEDRRDEEPRPGEGQGVEGEDGMLGHRRRDHRRHPVGQPVYARDGDLEAEESVEEYDIQDDPADGEEARALPAGMPNAKTETVRAELRPRRVAMWALIRRNARELSRTMIGKAGLPSGS